MMTFPQTITTEIYVGGAWTDVSGYVYQRDGTEPIRITRGRQSESSVADPQICNLQLNNRDGRFSTRKPDGPYYGTIGRNTPVRVSVPGGKWLDVPDRYSGVSCPDSVALSITGTIDLRLDADILDWSADTVLMAKWGFDPNKSWLWSVSRGLMTFRWTVDGSTIQSTTARVPIREPWTGRRTVRVVFYPNNGSGSHVCDFYESLSLDGPWTHLGSTIVMAGTTSIYDSTSRVYISDVQYISDIVGTPMRVYGARIYSGVGGTLVSAPDFTAATPGTGTYTDPQSNVWTVHFHAFFTPAKNFRFCGEISQMPVEWDLTGRDVWVDVEAAGVLRRIGARRAPVKSAYYRGCTSTVTPVTDLVAYWPMEETVGATTVSSGLPGGRRGSLSGTLVWESDTESFVCSAPLPNIGTCAVTLPASPYADTGTITVRALVAVPAAGSTDGAVLLSIRSGGVRWDLQYGSGLTGGWRLQVYDGSGVLIYTSGWTSYWGLNGRSFSVALLLTQTGSDVDWVISRIYPSVAAGGYYSGTVPGVTLGTCRSVTVNADKSLTNVTVGHVTVQSADPGIFDLAELLAAHAGETAGTRIARLCAEEGLAYRILGSASRSAPLGAQLRRTIMELLRECETADGGILYESRDRIGIEYRCVEGLSRQDPAVVLSYSSAHLSALVPVEDDQATVNSISMSRVGGGTARQTVAVGALSVLDPPDGAGLYDQQLDVSAAADAQLPDMASWRVQAGTVDEPRYPGLAVDLARGVFVADSALTAQVLGLDVGRRLVVTGLDPVKGPPEDVSQIAVGFTEIISPFQHIVRPVCVPNAVYVSGLYDAGDRYDSGASTLTNARNTVQTVLSVSVSDGVLWSHADGDFDIMIAGERMTVTGVAGSSSPQTFTVVRSVNGVVKNQAAGAEIVLFSPVRYGI